MTTRTIIYTGKGGVGKTSVAAATARRCAAGGRRTLLISTDPAHSLADSLGLALAPSVATAVLDDESLWALEVDAQIELERHWGRARGWLSGLLTDRGIDHVTAQELTVPPGMDELFSLLSLQEHSRSGDWDVIVVDCAPTGETLRLLSFPDAARWWLQKVFPMERALLAAAAPIARGMLDISLPDSAALGDLHQLSENLLAMDAILRDHEHTSMRLVMTPDRMVIGEAMRSFTYLNLYGYLTDAVVVNRVFPEDSGEYFADWREHQQRHIEVVKSAFSPVPVLLAPYFEEEVSGSRMLDRLAGEIFDAERNLAPTSSADAGGSASSESPVDHRPDAWDLFQHSITQQIESDEQGARLRLSIPFVEKGEISLKQVGAEIVISAPKLRRTVMLPSSLATMQATGASFEGGALEVTFSRV